VINSEYLLWIHDQPSIVPSHDPKCIGCPVTAHHVRRFGEAKNDERTVPLFYCRHVMTAGDNTVHHGKTLFEECFCLSLEDEIVRLRDKYLKEMGIIA
jgi:hypothetical protein